MDELIKRIATDFYFHWHNTDGNNTSQGFDEWWQSNKLLYKEDMDIFFSSAGIISQERWNEIEINSKKIVSKEDYDRAKEAYSKFKIID